MINAIGLGKAGREIVDQLNQDIFNCIPVDVDAGVLIEKQKTFEDYETGTHKEKFAVIKVHEPRTFLFLAGGGKITGVVLRLLEYLKVDKNQTIAVHYIRPDLELLSSKEKLRERATYRVLQELARSGMIEEIVLYSNQAIDDLLGNNGIGNYYSEINKTIVSTVEMIQFLENQPSLLGNLVEPEEVSRISSLGVLSEDYEEKPLFKLSFDREKQFFFALPGSMLETHKTLLQEIKNLGTMVGSDTKISYKVISTDYDKKYVYVKNFTNIIQE
tara:strand:+ start:65 stop:883 length:819 start_codon:yes stop_codon:yes gene_type:complete